MTPSARFADVLLPATTWFEKNDLCTIWGHGDSLIFMNQAIAPMDECRTDYDICALIAARLGLGGGLHRRARPSCSGSRRWSSRVADGRPDVPELRRVPAPRRPRLQVRPAARARSRSSANDPIAHPLEDAVGEDRDLLDRGWRDADREPAADSDVHPGVGGRAVGPAPPEVPAAGDRPALPPPHALDLRQRGLAGGGACRSGCS